ncbi:hypothetical protein P7K49_008747, partial [Saguinus oedipus]
MEICDPDGTVNLTKKPLLIYSVTIQLTCTESHVVEMQGVRRLMSICYFAGKTSLPKRLEFDF